MSRGFLILPSNFIINCKEPLSMLCVQWSHIKGKNRSFTPIWKLLTVCLGKRYCSTTNPSPKTPCHYEESLYTYKIKVQQIHQQLSLPMFISDCSTYAASKTPMPVAVVCAPKCPPSHFSSRLQQHLYIEKMRCNCEKDTFENLRSWLINLVLHLDSHRRH